MKKYYLDTNVIIRLGNRILSPFIKENCYTSSLVIAELLKNLTKENFKGKKGTISNINSSEIKIDWRTIGEILLNSFAIEKEDNLFQIDFITKINFEALLKSESIDLYHENRNDIFDAYHGINFPEKENGYKLRLDFQFNYLIDNLMSDYSQKSDKIIHSLIENMNKINGKEKLKFDTMKIKLLNSLKDLLFHNNKENILYDGKIDFFFKALFYYSKNNLSVKKNDAFDLFHFLFINKGCILISEDKLIKGICNNNMNNNYMSYSNFNKYL